MSPEQAIADCRKTHPIQGASWPVPLIDYLDVMTGAGRVFDWLISCVEAILDRYGKGSAELKETLSFARRFATLGGNTEEVEQRAWSIWFRRSSEYPTLTAVAQLLFALSRGVRLERSGFIRACGTPIVLLEKLESRRGEVLDLVVSHFESYVRDRGAELSGS